MRALGLSVAVLLVGCGPPSWPEVAWPGEPVDDEATRFSVEPADPIEREHVVIVVPVAHDGQCLAYGATVRSEASEGATQLFLEPASPEMCAPTAISGGGTLVPLGPLTPGSYLARAGELELRFEVRPSSTSPGEPPLWWRAAHAVAQAHHVGSACGPSDGETPSSPWRERAARLHHQVATAHSEWSEAEVEAAMCAAQSVTVRAVSARELRYRHFAGSLCHRAEAIGTVVVRDDGSLEVGEPYIVHGEDVPC